MPSFIDLIQSSQLRWLTVPRYAVIYLPVMLAGGAGIEGKGPISLFMLLVAALGSLRLLWFKLLPYEQAKLLEAKQAMQASQPERAVRILKGQPRFAGKYYQLKSTILLARAYNELGEFIDAYKALSFLDKQQWLPDEHFILQVAWAHLFIEVDNLVEAKKRLAEIPHEKCIANINCLILKAELDLQDENFSQSRELLESGLSCNQNSEKRVLLYNNLARLENMQGRDYAQLQYLQAARQEFNKSPNAALADLVHHNLAIALIRAGQPSEAKQVLSEALAAGNTENIHHVIAVLNNHLHTAREAGDVKWKHNVYEEFERQLKKLPNFSPREQLALDISRLRMNRNDGIRYSAVDYPDKIERLLNRLDTPLPAIPEHDYVAAIVELRHDLRLEAEEYLQTMGCISDVLSSLQRRAARQLLQYKETIDIYLRNIPPKLIITVMLWHRYRNEVDKARIELAEEVDIAQAEFRSLFGHLREKAEWLTEQSSTLRAIEAWLQLCDELVAYHDQLPLNSQLYWRTSYAELALYALEQATTHMKGLKNTRYQIVHLIGLAYFNLKLRNDKKTAMNWMKIVHSYQPSLHHYSIWLREQYTYICEELIKDRVSH